MDSFQTIGDILRGARNIGIAAHVRPDGDAVGSVLGLALSLRAMGKTVHALLEDGVPSNLAFLPATDTIIQPAADTEMDIDVAVALDTAAHDRLGAQCCRLFAKAGTLVNIDHHGTNPGYGTCNRIDATQPATGQMIYELLTDQGFPIDGAVRQHLFAAISTDTGSFQFSCTTARSHEIAAEMMRAGLDTAEMARLLYQTHPMRRLDLMRAMLNEMVLDCDGRVVSWQLTQKLIQSVAMEPGDTEGLIDTLRMIDTVISAVIFEELPDGKVRVSARAKDARLDVAAVCQQFGGGGHRAAAGARMKGPMTEAAERFNQALIHEVRRLA